MNIKDVYDDVVSSRKKKIIIDTDTYNEIDDQFAVAYALRSKDRLEVLSFNAAPFLNQRSVSAKDGMEKSFIELKKIISLTEPNKNYKVCKGSEAFLSDKKTPVMSEAAQNIIDTANSMKGEKLYVVAIGAITNVASALLIAPEIASKIVVVWLGMNKRDWKNNEEFNLIQDVTAAQVVLESGALFVQVPCMGVTSMFTSTIPELKACLDGKNELCDYLVKSVIKYAKIDDETDWFGWSKVIWDIVAIGIFTKPESMEFEILNKATLTDDKKWKELPSGEEILAVKYIYRDPVYIDCFNKLINQ